jgi:hypothetical protein
MFPICTDFSREYVEENPDTKLSAKQVPVFNNGSLIGRLNLKEP